MTGAVCKDKSYQENQNVDKTKTFGKCVIMFI